MRDFFRRSLLILRNRVRWDRQHKPSFAQRMGRRGGQVTASRRRAVRLRCGDRVIALPPLDRDNARVPRPRR